jgi:hypothetical protein
LAKTGYQAQQSGRPLQPGRPNTLFHPADEESDYGAHGSIDEEAHPRSWHLWLIERWSLVMGGVTAATLVAAAFARREGG